MAELRAACESIGSTDVATYIQSGNVALTSALPAARLRDAIEKAVGTQLGVRAAVAVRSQAQMNRLVAANPFPDAEAGTVHVAFLTNKPTRRAIAALRAADAAPERLVVSGSQIYLHLPHGYGRAGLPALIEKLLPRATTVRNWRTVTALYDMLNRPRSAAGG